jgi:DNA polymerase elongation subunit (family B)
MKIKDISSFNDKLFITYSDGTKKSAQFEWYFYIHNTDLERFMRTFGGQYSRVMQGKEYTRIYNDSFLTRTSLAPRMHQVGIKTYEADLTPEERFKYDKLPEIDTKIDVLYFDIETDDRERRIMIGRDYIVSFSAIDSQGKKFKYVLKEMNDEAEIEFLTEISQLFRKYTIVSGWNIDNFDIPYIKSRAARYESKIKLRIGGSYDLFQRCKHIYRYDNTVKSFSLNNFAKRFLGDEKIKHEMSIYDMWKYDQDSLLKYNMKDAVLCKQLDEKLDITGMMFRMCEWCRVIPRKFSIYQLIDSFIIQVSHQMKRPVPTNLKAIDRKDEMDPDKYLGAEVLDPVIGVHNNTYVFDFKQLYPSIMMTLNIGFDSLKIGSEIGEDDIRCPGTYSIPREYGGILPTGFSKDPSCVAESVRRLSTFRKEYKKLKGQFIAAGRTNDLDYAKVVSDEIIVKELSNSVYGIMGMIHGRYYDKNIAESITLTGRWMLHFAKSFFEDHTNSEVIYGDTDSIFVKPRAEFDANDALNLFHTSVENELKTNYGVLESALVLNYDKRFKKFILFAKKTYAGAADFYEGENVELVLEKGIDYIKRNVFKWAGDKQKELIKDIVTGKLEDRDVVTRIREYKSEFYHTTFTGDELKITQRINKESYTSDSAVKRLVEEITNETGINPIGTEIAYVVIPSRSKKIRAVLLDKFMGQYSREHYWEHKTRPLLEKILKIVSPGQKIDNYDLFLEC